MANGTYDLLLIDNLSATSKGYMSQSEVLAQKLTERGFNVFLCSYKSVRPQRLFDMLKTTILLRKQYRLAHISLFSGMGLVWALSVAMALNLMGKPYIVTLRGGNLPQFSKRWPASVRWLLKRAKTVQAPSEYLAKSLRDFRTDIRIVPNAIDISDYKMLTREYAEPKLIWVRAFDNIYNPKLLPVVIGKLVGEFPNIIAVMIGPDKGDGSLQQCKYEAERLGVSDRITFTGGITHSEVPNWLGKLSIFVNTTNYDNVPVSVLQAAASGLCIVSTNVGGIPYLLTDELNALLVPSNDADAMSDAIRRVLLDNALAQALSHGAIELAKRHDWAQILKLWEETLS